MSTTTVYELKIESSNAKDIYESITTNKNIDFDKIEKTPEDLYFDENDINYEIKSLLESGSCTPSNVKLLLVKIKDEDAYRKAESYVNRFLRDNKRKYGCLDHYDWQEENWGSFGSPQLIKNKIANDKILIRFSWLGLFDEKIWIKLSKKFPTAKITLKYANERLGYFSGISSFFNGRKEIILKEINFLSGIKPSKEHNKLSFNLCYPDDDPAEFAFDVDWNDLSV